MPSLLQKEWVVQQTAFRALQRFCPVTGKRVLEVGGNSNCAAAIPFAQAGAGRVVVTGLYHVDPESQVPESTISLELADALKLDGKFAPGSFDMVYGLSILEHIPRPLKFLSQVSHVLSKGGMAFLQGSPLWTSAWGHHIHLTPWQNNTFGTYQFLPQAALLDKGVDTKNPIPDWGHLLYTPDELGEIIASKIDCRDRDRILNFIFRDDVVNREGANSIINAVALSGLMVLEMEYDRTEVPEETRRRLVELHGHGEDFSIMGIRMVLKKL